MTSLHLDPIREDSPSQDCDPTSVDQTSPGSDGARALEALREAGYRLVPRALSEADMREVLYEVNRKRRANDEIGQETVAEILSAIHYQGPFERRADAVAALAPNFDVAAILVGYRNMGPEGDKDAAIAHLCDLLATDRRPDLAALSRTFGDA